MIDWTDFRRTVTQLAVSLHLMMAAGCGYLSSKRCCPVYLPYDHLIGSEAVRVSPCGPDGPFYGLTKTTWREWPAEWQLWQTSVGAEDQRVETLPPSGLGGPLPAARPLPRSEPRGVSNPPLPNGNEAAPRAIEPATPLAAPGDSRIKRDLRKLFGPLESDHNAPDTRPLEVEPAPPATPVAPGLSPGARRLDESFHATARPSSWSLVDRKLPAPVATDRHGPLEEGQARPTGLWPANSPPARQANRRAPRPSKLRR